MPRGSDEQKFRQWLGDHRAIVHKVARAFARSTEDREDLTQEILLRLWMSMPMYRAESKVSTWIYRVALNRALTWRRDSSRWTGIAPTNGDIVESVKERGHDESDLLEKLYDAIGTLAEVDRSLMLMALDERSYQEIAEVMGMTVNHVGVRLCRAKARLAELLRSKE